MSKTLEYSQLDLHEVTPTWLDGNKNSQFDDLLRNSWDQAMENGIFRYSMDHIQTKILDGPKQYVAQLNVKRATERRMPHEMLSMNQPFNPNIFNFTKIKEKEIILVLRNTDDNIPSDNNNSHNSSGNRHVIIVNISPIEYGHVLIVPHIDSCLPQILTEKAIQIGIEAVLLSGRRSFRLGFNSLCAYASVNHLHFHAYYLEHELIVEYAPVHHITDILYQSNAMPVPGFVFQVHGCKLSKLKRVIHKIIEYFQVNEIGHSVLIVRGTVFGEERTSDKRTVRIYVWPRKKFKGMSPEAFNIAVVEMGGHFPIKDEESYKTITEKSADEILETAKLPDEEFNKIKSDVTKIVFEDSETTDSSSW